MRVKLCPTDQRKNTLKKRNCCNKGHLNSFLTWLFVNSFIFHMVLEDITVVTFNESERAIDIINNIFVEIMIKH